MISSIIFLFQMGWEGFRKTLSDNQQRKTHPDLADPWFINEAEEPHKEQQPSDVAGEVEPGDEDTWDDIPIDLILTEEFIKEETKSGWHNRFDFDDDLALVSFPWVQLRTSFTSIPARQQTEAHRHRPPRRHTDSE